MKVGEEKAVLMAHLDFEVGEKERGANCQVCGGFGMVRDLKVVGHNYWLTACRKCLPDREPVGEAVVADQATVTGDAIVGEAVVNEPPEIGET